MRNLLFFIAIVVMAGSCTQDNVHMPETTVDTITVTKHDTVRIPDANQFLYIGNNQVVVGGSFIYNATILYKITKDTEKNTLTVAVPEYELSNTAIGDLVIGKYTIEDIPYDENRAAYYKEYADGTLSMHFKSSSGIDNDYVFNNNTITTSIYSQHYQQLQHWQYADVYLHDILRKTTVRNAQSPKAKLRYLSSAMGISEQL